MSATRVQGQQGGTNSSSAKVVVRTDKDFTPDNNDDVVTCVARLTVTLPPHPYAGQTHTVVAKSGTVTVQGGAWPLIGGDQLVLPGNSLGVVFDTEDEWVVTYAADLDLPDNLVQTAFGNVTESVSLDNAVDTLLVSLPWTTLEDTFTTFLASYSFAGVQAGAIVTFRVEVDGTPVTSSSSTVAGDRETASGPLLFRLPLDAGLHTVELKAIAGTGAALIDTSVGGNACLELLETRV